MNIPTIEEIIKTLQVGAYIPKQRALAPPAPSKKSKGRKKKRSKKKDKAKTDHILMLSKYKNTCQHCKKAVSVGDKVWWSSQTHKVIHFRCFEEYKGYGR